MGGLIPITMAVAWTNSVIAGITCVLSISKLQLLPPSHSARDLVLGRYSCEIE
jgi:hypothetical protein